MPTTTQKMPLNSFSEFAKLVREAFYKTYGSNSIGFVAAYPKESQNYPLVTYKLVKSQPGTFKNVKEIKPRLRETVRQPLYTTEVWAQRIEYIVRFDIWAADGQSADEIAESFEDMIAENVGEFQKAGLIEMIWLGQQNDAQTKEWNVDLTNRSITYLVTLDRGKFITYYNITDIDTNVTVQNPQP